MNQSVVTILLNDTDLKNVKCAELLYLQAARSSFPIYIQFAVPDEHSLMDREVIVTGAAFYYPFVNEKETLPKADALINRNDEIPSASSGCELFWQGRLLKGEANLEKEYVVNDQKVL